MPCSLEPIEKAGGYWQQLEGWCPLSATLSKATRWPPTSFMSPILAGSWASSVADFLGNKKLKILIQTSTKGKIWDHLLIFDNRVLARWICICASKIQQKSSCGTFCPSGIESYITTGYWICPSIPYIWHNHLGLKLRLWKEWQPPGIKFVQVALNHTTTHQPSIAYDQV